jgi:hypothetical protein
MQHYQKGVAGSNSNQLVGVYRIFSVLSFRWTHLPKVPHISGRLSERQTYSPLTWTAEENPLRRKKQAFFLHYLLSFILRRRRSQWPRGLRHELSSPAQTLGSWVRIPLEAWMSVCIYTVFVLSCVQVAGADPPSKESYRLYNLTPWPLVRKRTIPTERPPLVEVSASFCGQRVSRGQRNASSRPLIRFPRPARLYRRSRNWKAAKVQQKGCRAGLD